MYIIYSESSDRYYVGQCQDISERIKRHNTGRSKYTKIAIDWKVKYIEKFDSRSEAMIREREIKSKKSRKYIEFLVRENKA